MLIPNHGYIVVNEITDCWIRLIAGTSINVSNCRLKSATPHG